MTRRHSVCLSDIPYDYDHGYGYSSYESPDDDANADPNDTITVYTLRRASSPVMASSYNAGRAVNMNMNMNTTTPAPSMSSTATTILAGDAHGHGHGLPRAGKKPKKKKPKKNKRSKAKDEKEDNSPESVHSAVTVTDIAESSTTTTTVGDNGGQGQPISAPLIVNGANWNWKQKQMSEPTHNSVHDTGDGLQRFLSTHHPPLYMMGPSPGPAANHPMPMPIPGAPFTPSEATTDNTVRAYSIPSNNPLSHRYNYGDAHGHGHGHAHAHAHMTVCPEHGRALCRVFPGCCVHRAVPGSCAYCPVARSCCCVHHAGDCCYCFGGGDVRDGPGFEGREVQGNGDGNGSEGTDGTATSTNETVHEAVRESIHESESVDETNESVNESEIQVQVVDETETETVHETVYESVDETVDEVNEKETVDENETINEDNEVNDINETNKTVKETINDASEKETVDEADENKTVNEINETNETVNKTANEANEANEDGTNGTTNAQTQAQAQLTTHTLSLLETETFSDCRLTLKSTTNNFYPTTFHAHRALLSRSPRIATILHTATYRDGANNEITAAAGDAFSMAQAFETSVQNLYGLPVLDRVGLRRATLAALGYDYREEDWRDGNEAARFPFPVHVAMADFALCYAASGAFFEDEGVAEAGVRLALELVGYGENIEMLLSFALCPRRFLINTCPGNLPSSGPATKKDKKDSDSKNSALLKTQCLDITKTALTHLTAQIPPATPFHFYNSAQPGPSLLADRIPEPLRRYPGSVLSNPKLAEVKFGSFEEMQPNPAVERTSAVLLSLPFEGLRAAFWMLAEKGFLNEGVARAVLVEREARRLYALRVWGKWKAEREREVRELGKKAKRLRRKNGGAAAAAAAAVGDDEVKVLGYREFFTAKDEQICLEREWVGLDIL